MMKRSPLIKRENKGVLLVDVSPPRQREGGLRLQAGDMWSHKTTGGMYIWDGYFWVPARAS